MTAGQKNPSRCNVYIDGEYEFSIPIDGVMEYKLKVEMEITQQLVDTLLDYDAQKKATEKAMDFISRRNHGVGELVDKLVQKGFEREVAQDVCNNLEEKGYLDDEVYGQMLYEHLRQKGYGPMRIKQEMRQKKLDKELIEEILEENSDHGNEDIIRGMIEKKLRFRSLQDDKLKKKVIDYLLRYGYGYGEVKPLVEEYFADEGEDTWE